MSLDSEAPPCQRRASTSKCDTLRHRIRRTICCNIHWEGIRSFYLSQEGTSFHTGLRSRHDFWKQWWPSGIAEICYWYLQHLQPLSIDAYCSVGALVVTLWIEWWTKRSLRQQQRDHNILAISRATK